MRSALLAVSLLVFTCFQVFGQQSYERAYPGANGVVNWSASFSTLDNTLWYATVSQTMITLHHVDATGTIISTYQYSGMNAQNVNVEQSVNGNIYLCGQEAVSGVVYYVMALDFTGSVLWTKEYDNGTLMSYGYGRIKTLPTGNVMIIESAYGHIGYIEVDGNTGSVVGSHALREDTTAENKTPGFSADVYNDGSFVFTGKRGSDIAVVHTDPTGNVLWSTVLNSGNGYYHTKGVATLSDGSAITCGMQNNTPFIMKLDANGQMQWFNSYNGSTTFYDVKQLDANSFGAIGVSGMDVVYSRFDMNGNEIGTIRFTYPGFQFESYALQVDVNGKVAIPFGYVDQAAASGLQPGLMLLEPNFNFSCGMSFETLTPSTSSIDPSIVNVPIYSIPQTVTVTNILVTPSIQPTTATTDLCIILNVDNHDPNYDFALQNSPAFEGQSVTFSFGDYRGEVAYVVTDALGREVSRNVITYNGGNEPVKKSDQLTPGMYIITTYSDGETHSEKFLIR